VASTHSSLSQTSGSLSNELTQHQSQLTNFYSVYANELNGIKKEVQSFYSSLKQDVPTGETPVKRTFNVPEIPVLKSRDAILTEFQNTLNSPSTNSGIKSTPKKNSQNKRKFEEKENRMSIGKAATPKKKH